MNTSHPSHRSYWRSLDELARTKDFTESLHREFPAHASEWLADFSRRDFLKLMAASFALAGLTSCTRQPLEKIVPYVKQPEELIPGKPLYFATAMTLGGYATGLLVESHDGHPTKIEGNPQHPMSLGASNVFHQASLLDLYDPDRTQSVLKSGEVSSWAAFLSALHDALEVQKQKRGAGLRILTETVTSPTLHAQINAVLKKFPEARWHQYEPINRDNVHEGARLSFGEVVAAQCHFDKARVVLALDSDFMVTHPAGLRFARDFTNGRRVAAGKPEMNRLYAVETTPTVTGSNADHRLALRSDEIQEFALALAERLGAIPPRSSRRQSAHLPFAIGDLTLRSQSFLTSAATKQWLTALADDLQQNRGKSIVIAGGCQPPLVHALAHAMNEHLGNIGETVRFTRSAEAEPVNQLESMRALVEELKAGKIGLLVMLGGNPVFNAPADFEFGRQLAKARLTVHLSPDVNETSALCHWHIPQNHYLETWSDARAYDGTISIIQPLILPLYAGKSAHEVLDAFLHQPNQSDYDIVREYWQGQRRWKDFEKGWRRSLHDGLVTESVFPARSVSLPSFPLTPAISPQEREDRPPIVGESEVGESSIDSRAKEDDRKLFPLPGGEGLGEGKRLEPRRTLEITFRLDPSVWDGRFANNGWLQELPKPITKLTWDNAALISPQLAQRESLANGDFVELESGGRKLHVPVWITPGQAENSVAVHLGYGRMNVGHVGRGSGFNAFALRTSHSPWSEQNAKLTKLTGRYQLVTTQTHQAIDSPERQILREATLAEFLANSGKMQDAKPPSEHGTLFNPEEHRYDGNRWGMSIDLATCIGCNACVLACQSENNIPVVGKQQVARHRQMHWIRVDTYFSGDPERPAMSHQPVPCMHCENAPCELVCPVAATLHDKEGLNLQVYNRCIGTRYCSNNCPYKVRRFNFFQYADYHTPSLKPMRNPNVTVRWRGVMEKCTYCIQRISAARIQAKIDNRGIRDGEVIPACAQACPAEAIVFGDLSDPNSRVSKLKRHQLDFSMLAELNTRPRTTYLAKLRNPNPELVS